MKKYYLLILLANVILNLSACDGKKNEQKPPIELLSQEAKFSIGKNIFRVPLIAIYSNSFSRATIPCGDSENEFKNYCGIPLAKITEKKQVPIPVVSLSISMDRYKYFNDSKKDEPIYMPNFCPKLSQKWAKQRCNDELIRQSILSNFPNYFDLIDPLYINYLDISWIGGAQKNTGEFVRELDLKIGKPQRACGLDKNGSPLSLCVAALKLKNDLLAVWIVTRREGIEKVIQDSAAIKAFVKFGISETENYPELEKAIKNINYHMK
jgi:hypothetical protein